MKNEGGTKVCMREKGENRCFDRREMQNSVLLIRKTRERKEEKFTECLQVVRERCC